MKKKFIKLQALILAGVMALGLAGCSKKQTTSEPTSYHISMDTIKTGDDDASLFNVGNFRVKGKSGLNEIIKANKKGTPAGAIINSIAENKGEILLDAEYAKYLVKSADLDYPIYLDVTELMKNNSLRIDEILELISVFCSKLESNEMFVGVYGSEEDIQKLKKYDETDILKSYDILLKNNNPDIDLDIESFIKTNEDGTYETSSNLPQIINNKNKNNKNGFVYDLLYTIKEEEDIADIAYSFGLSVNDLLTYNGIKSIENVKSIRIPSMISTKSPVTSIIEETSSKKVLLGVDISYCQDDSSADWEELSEKADFAILKVSQGSNIDRTFEYKASKCAEYGIPMGAYCYNNYHSNDNMTQFKSNVDQQTKTFISAISGKKITFPAYLDIEGNLSLTNNQMTYLIDSWFDSISATGLKPGIYAGKANFQYIKDHYQGSHDLEKDFEIWLCGDFDAFNNRGIWYNQSNSYSNIVKALEQGEITSNDFIDTRRNNKAKTLQISAATKGFGIGNADGFVDVDITLNNYIEKAVQDNAISQEEAHLLEIMTPEQKSKTLYEIQKVLETGEFSTGFISGGIFSLTTATAAVLLLEYIKKRKEQRGIYYK